MTVNYLIVNNYFEIKKAEDLGIREPEAVYIKKKLLFDLTELKFARITEENLIELKIDNDYFFITYNKEVWNTLEAEINAR